VSIQFLGKLPNARLYLRRCDREGKRIETDGLVVTGIVSNAEPATSPQGPHHMNAARQNAQEIRIIERNTNKHIVG
jgi:hypothetical protein